MIGHCIGMLSDMALSAKHHKRADSDAMTWRACLRFKRHTSTRACIQEEIETHDPLGPNIQYQILSDTHLASYRDAKQLTLDAATSGKVLLHCQRPDTERVPSELRRGVAVGLLLRRSSSGCVVRLMSSRSLSFMLWRAEGGAAAAPLRGVGSATAIPGSLRPAVRGTLCRCFNSV